MNYGSQGPQKPFMYDTYLACETPWAPSTAPEGEEGETNPASLTWNDLCQLQRLRLLPDPWHTALAICGRGTGVRCCLVCCQMTDPWFSGV